MKFNLKKTLFILLLVVLAIGKIHPVRGTNASIFTISVWVKPSSSAVSKAIVGKAEEFRVATNASSQPVCQIKSSAAWQTAATSSAAISVDAWSHVSCTYDLAYVRIYVNGIEKGSQALAVAADDTSAVVKIGRDDSGSTPYGYFAGQVDEFKFYTSALSPEQIKLDMNQGKELQLGGQSSATGATGQAAEYCVPGDATSCAPPVGEWKFDEKTGGSVNDTSGNGNLGTWNGTGTQHWTRGKFGSAGNFNGTDDYVDVANESNFDITGAITVQAWLKVNAFTKDWQAIVTKGNSSWRIARKSSNNYLDWATTGLSTLACSGVTAVNDGRWHFVSGTYDGAGNKKLYLDGKVECSQTGLTGSISTNNSNVAIGENLESSRVWNGSIDQVQIFNYARTPAQIAWDYNRGKPVGHWKLDEGEGDRAYDSSGNGNTGTLTNMELPGDWVDGKFGKALTFQSNDIVAVPETNSSLDFTERVSVSAWIKPTSLGTFELVHKGNSSGGNFEFWESVYQLCWRGVASFCTTSSPLTAGNWHHIVATYDKVVGYVYIYSNGKLVGSAPGSTNLTPNNDPFHIAAYSTGAYCFNGTIDDVRVYNYALTPLQIQQIMNEGSQIRFGE